MCVNVSIGLVDWRVDISTFLVSTFLLDCQAVWLVSQSLVAVRRMPSSPRSPTMSETRAKARRTAMLLKGRMVQPVGTPSASATAAALAREGDATASALARLEQQIAALTERAQDLGAELSVESAAVWVDADVKGPSVSICAAVKGPAVSGAAALSIPGASAVPAGLLGPDGKVDRAAALERLKLLTQLVPLVKEQLELQQKQLIDKKSSTD